jgi:hypothetical protein
MDFPVFVPPPDPVQRSRIRIPYSEFCILDALFIYPAPPETPASRDKLIQPFSRQNTECVPWFASFCAAQNDFRGAFRVLPSSFILHAFGMRGAGRRKEIFTQRRKGRKVSDPERRLTTLRRSEAVQGTARFAGGPAYSFHHEAHEDHEVVTGRNA